MLTDVQMPDMDGFELTESIRKVEASGARRLPIIAMTAHAMKGIREQCLAAGMDDYVSKPIHDDELIAAIRRATPAGDADTLSEFSLRQQDTGEFALPPASVFDEAAVIARVGGNREILQQLIGVFYQDCNNQMDALNGAIKSNNALGVRSAAHTIKGMVAFFGAKGAADTAVKLEQAGVREELAGASLLFGELARELLQLETALGQFAPSPQDGWHLGLGDRSSADIFDPAGV